ncbi:MAG: DUF3025 domain-containing protein [Burkholderiaceae bacterium]
MNFALPIDWPQPWLADWRGKGEPLAQAVASGLPLHEALNSSHCSPVRFVPQHELPAGTAYESHIFRTAECPTREGLHDFFNGLMWQYLPLTKRRMNQLQALAIAQQGPQSTRGPLRDALTLLDENGALLQAPPLLWQALVAQDWTGLFITHRELWKQARLLLLGHALLEKLVQPRKSITAHVWCSQAQGDASACWDAWFAAELEPGKLARKPFAPLPVLGVPGWWADNETPRFYDDPQVFRLPRPGALPKP